MRSVLAHAGPRLIDLYLVSDNFSNYSWVPIFLYHPCINLKIYLQLSGIFFPALFGDPFSVASLEPLNLNSRCSHVLNFLKHVF